MSLLGLPKFDGFAGLEELAALTEIDEESSETGATGECAAHTAFLSGLCQRMLSDLHRSKTASLEEKESSLKRRVVCLDAERRLFFLEDPEGLFTSTVTEDGTGTVLWPASFALISLLDQQVEECRQDFEAGGEDGRLNVLELGAGLGAPGIFLAKYKRCRVVTTDSPGSIEILERNVEEAKLGDLTPEVLPLSFGCQEALTTALDLGPFGLIIGSDITYHQESLEDILVSARRLMKPKVGRLILSLQDRRGEVFALEEACRRNNFQILSRQEGQLTISSEEGSIVEDGKSWERVTPELLKKTSPWNARIWIYTIVDAEGEDRIEPLNCESLTLSLDSMD
eukprot:TRINITY_DN27948_c0_g1_i1.p1 TRINITY_DN27948_c0_g1~~TRINITY_DN27948_c0_g1_i1.p1  ORF type:complete len:359 (-),score=66.30 TRINITY_DN27948_c0_g1_i1:20-1039(-)